MSPARSPSTPSYTSLATSTGRAALPSYAPAGSATSGKIGATVRLADQNPHRNCILWYKLIPSSPSLGMSGAVPYRSTLPLFPLHFSRSFFYTKKRKSLTSAQLHFQACGRTTIQARARLLVLRRAERTPQRRRGTTPRWLRLRQLRPPGLRGPNPRSRTCCRFSILPPPPASTT